MSTQHTANVYIKNSTGGNAYIQMSHKYSNEPADTYAWQVAPGASAGPMKVYYNGGWGSTNDYWYCSASVQDGDNTGIYACAGTLMGPTVECALETSDDGSTFTNEVSISSFKINIPSGGHSTKVAKFADYAAITNVFVFMLENHSFDHLLGYANIPGLNKLIGTETNLLLDVDTGVGIEYGVMKPAVDPMPVGPGHEFMDTMVQLCGPAVTNPFPTGPYPSMDNDGFLNNYADQGASTDTPPGSTLPPVSDVMHCCDPTTQIPTLLWLAQQFAVCDSWYSSMPGPTWPNRLFAMGGSSAGLDDSPSSSQVEHWEMGTGFQYQHGSIFDALKTAKKQYRLYNDFWDTYGSGGMGTGSFAIVAGLDNISKTGVHSIEYLNDDLNGKYPYQLTWIEPNYGDADGDFSGGSSQHPVDTLAGGEKMLAAVYNAIRTSPYWATSVLIVTYDEHGGFFDHVPPPAAIKPGDSYAKGLNTNGFDFSQYGIRVPAVVVSPRIPLGTVSHTTYDHTSILRTVEDAFGVGHLTARDQHANGVTGLLSLAHPRFAPTRVDGPEVVLQYLGIPDPPTIPPMNLAMETDLTPLPAKGNIYGFLHIAMQTDFALSDQSEAERARILAIFKALKTKGQARAYIRKVLEKLVAYKARLSSGVDQS